MPQRTYPKGLILDELGERVSETEQALGSSNDVAALPDSTGVTFDGGPPDGAVRFLLDSEPGPADGSEIYRGTAWDAGNDVNVVAYRMAAG